MKKVATLLLAGVFISSQCYGGFVDSFQLQEACADNKAEFYRQCVGYIAGVNDSHKTIQNWDNQAPYYCLPSGASMGQLTQVVINYLKLKPEELHLSASGRVLNAFILAFPCE